MMQLLGKSLAVSHKVKHAFTVDPTPGETEARTHTATCTLTVVAETWSRMSVSAYWEQLQTGSAQVPIS